MGHGGKRQGAGRPKGAITRRTVESISAAEAAGIMPLEYMLRAMRDAPGSPRADDMAKAAAPYVHAKLAAVDATLQANVDGSVTFTWLPVEAAAAAIEDDSDG